jgi:HAD superfamily hydrolase (TIGR01509 family)
LEKLKALLWDVDGTLAETERDGHRVAFNLAFEAFDLPWRWDESRYGELLSVTGGRERLLLDMPQHADAPAQADAREALARALHAKKNEIYAQLVHEGRLSLREGVLALMRQCRARGLPMGIATTTSRSNIEALLRVHLGEGWAEWFAVTVCGEDVQRKKPDPQAYRLALGALRIEAREAVAIEDSPSGVDAARAAGIPVVVTRSSYFADATIEGAIAIGPGLHDRRGWRPALGTVEDHAFVGLDDIERWHAMKQAVSRPA